MLNKSLAGRTGETIQGLLVGLTNKSSPQRADHGIYEILKL